MEMRRIRKAKEQAIQIHEDKKSRLKAECEKERDEICKKYDMLFQHDEMVLTQKKKDFETHYKKVYVNKLLAETFRQGYECDKVGLSGIYKKEFNSSRPLLVSCDLKIARNITTNESMNAVRYAYLRTPDGRFRNPYNRGCRKNCADFLIVGHTDDDDDDETPWPSLQQVAQ